MAYLIINVAILLIKINSVSISFVSIYSDHSHGITLSNEADFIFIDLTFRSYINLNL